MLLLALVCVEVGLAGAGQGPTDVIVTNTPLPIFTNTPLPVREVATPASQPFQATAGELVGSAETIKEFTVTTVPAGKRLVIEHATAGGFFGGGNKLTASITTTVGSTSIAHQLVMVEQGAIADPVVFAAAQTMRLYADPGTVVKATFGRTDPPPPGTSGGVGMTISGYLVDVP